MYKDEMMLMISDFLYNRYKAEEFSFDFPARLSYIYKELEKEDKEFAELLDEYMPEICAAYEAHNTGDIDTIKEKEFKSKVLEVYKMALTYIDSQNQKAL